MTLFRSPLASPQNRGPPLHLGWAVGVAISLASLKPFTHPFSSSIFAPGLAPAHHQNQIKAQTSSGGKV